MPNRTSGKSTATASARAFAVGLALAMFDTSWREKAMMTPIRVMNSTTRTTMPREVLSAGRVRLTAACSAGISARIHSEVCVAAAPCE